jgi:hypothetical protein
MRRALIPERIERVAFQTTHRRHCYEFRQGDPLRFVSDRIKTELTDNGRDAEQSSRDVAHLIDNHREPTTCRSDADDDKSARGPVPGIKTGLR